MASKFLCASLASTSMVSSTTNPTRLLRCLLLVTLLSSFFVPSTAQVKGCPFDSIYSFGDGDSSTSNGLDMVDHLASAFHIPSPNPYTKEDSSKFSHGASFSTAGATIMSTAFFVERTIQPQPLKQSIQPQIESFTDLLRYICPSAPPQPNCVKKKLQRALFFVDQVGFNDYKNAFLQGKSIKEVSTYVPQVVTAIKSTIRSLIDAGATHLLVPGIPPAGCLPGYLTLFRSGDRMHYDANNCHVGLNTFARLHNDHLRQALMELMIDFPHVQIVYADYYKAFMSLLRNHVILGFRKEGLMKACCGFGGPYNFHPKKMCGRDQEVHVCKDPTAYVHWDGFHLTEAAAKHVVEAFMAGKGFVYPEFKFPVVMHCIM